MDCEYLKKKKIPDSPGVYLFKAGRDILYIGKATSLKDRVKSYFTKDLISTRGPLLVEMVFKVKSLDFIKTDSVLEALILEANLIKKYQPRYNTKEKDNKSFNYVIITKEDWPRVLIERGRNLFEVLGQERQILSDSTDIFLLKNYSCSRQSRSQVSQKVSDAPLVYFGPFPNSTQLKEAIKIIRKIFPFRDKCLPDQGRACFNKQIGLCPGICNNSISKKDYNKIVKNIILFFEGKKKQIIKNLNKEMIAFAKAGKYEQAGEVKKKIFALNHIQDVSLVSSFPALDRAGWHSDDGVVGKFRIEAYDASHLFGTNNVGVMVVMEDGELKKSDYRKFIIRHTKGDDIGALKEMLERRLKHTEWPIPDLIVLDGGIAQINVAKDSLKSTTAIVAVTKDDKHKAKKIIYLKNLSRSKYSDTLLLGYKKEILLINSEAHRFAISFHRQKRNATL